MIKKLYVKNFRSIKSLELEFGKINAFIGPNNAGKTNIMSALNMILGESYPSEKSILETDFYNHELSNAIEIKVLFDSTLSIEKYGEVWGFYLKICHLNGLFEIDYNPIDKKENVLHYSVGKEVRVTNEMRSKTLILFLSLKRDVETQLKANQWTIYGKILNELDKTLDGNSKKEFDKYMGEASKKLESEKYKKFINIVNQCVKNNSGLNIESEFIPFNSLNMYKNLQIFFKEPEQDLKFSADEMGRGIQSALSLGLLIAYKEIVKDSAILIIEEPEVYLHPHACRHFYSFLKRLADKNTVQVIYTTHNPCFIPIENYKTIYLTRKITGETKVINLLDDLPIDNIKFISLFNDRINEIFFSDKVVLVEGPADKILLEHATNISKIEKDKRNISIVECGGISEIKFIIKMLNKLLIKSVVLCDEDTNNETTKKELEEIKSLISKDSLYILKPNLEGEFGVIKKFDKREAILKTNVLNNINEYPQTFRELIKNLKGD